MARPGASMGVLLVHAAIMSALIAGESGCPAERRISVCPGENEDAILRNPDMGWVLIENNPLDQNPKGSSTLLVLPDDDFADVEYIALMFTWADVETAQDVYDFNRVNYAYDYWKAKGKRIHLRMATESFLWWRDSGLGMPQYLRERLSAEQIQTRARARGYNSRSMVKNRAPIWSGNCA